jgi:hypothetical protein
LIALKERMRESDALFLFCGLEHFETARCLHKHSGSERDERGSVPGDKPSRALGFALAPLAASRV